jgi:hypothetical protein
MAIRIANLTKTFDFIWDQDPDKDDPKKATVFKLGYLDSYDRAYLSDHIASFDGGFKVPTETVTADQATAHNQEHMRLETYRTAVDAMQLCLRGVENALDDDGKPITLAMVPLNFAGRTRLLADPEFIRSLDPSLCLAAYAKITEANKVSADERKNSKGAS